MTKKKVGASLWFAFFIVLFSFLWQVYHDFDTLWADGTFWIAPVILVGLVVAAVYTSKQCVP